MLRSWRRCNARSPSTCRAPAMLRAASSRRVASGGTLASVPSRARRRRSLWSHGRRSALVRPLRELTLAPSPSSSVRSSPARHDMPSDVEPSPSPVRRSSSRSSRNLRPSRHRRASSASTPHSARSALLALVCWVDRLHRPQMHSTTRVAPSQGTPSRCMPRRTTWRPGCGGALRGAWRSVTDAGVPNVLCATASPSRYIQGGCELRRRSPLGADETQRGAGMERARGTQLDDGGACVQRCVAASRFSRMYYRDDSWPRVLGLASDVQWTGRCAVCNQVRCVRDLHLVIN